MTDNDKLLQQRPIPADEPVTLEDEDDEQANRLAIGFAVFIPIGIALGLTVFDNVGIGVAIGLAMGGLYSLVMSQFVD